MARPQFIFGGDTGVSSPEELKRLRAVARELLGANRIAQNPGEGIAQVGQAIAGRITAGKAAKMESAGLASAASSMNPVLAALGLGGNFPAAPSSAGGSIADATPPGNAHDLERERDTSLAPPSALPASFLASVDKQEGGGDYDTLFGHAQKKGAFAGVRVSEMPISQVLAFADPKGPYAQSVKSQIGRVATPMGRHQIVGTTLRNAVSEMGIDPSTPFNRNTQDAIAAHLATKRIGSANTMGGKMAALRSEWEGFKHVPDAQLQQIVTDLENGGGAAAATSAMASGQPIAPAPVQVASLDPSAGMQSSSDAAPPYGVSPEQWAAMNAPDAPVQVASLDSSIGMSPQQPRPQQTAGLAVGPYPGDPTPIQSQPLAPVNSQVIDPSAAMMDPRSMTGGAPMPMQGSNPVAQALFAGKPPQQPPAANPRVAQALMGTPANPKVATDFQGTAVDSDMPGMSPMKPGGLDAGAIYQALQNPWLSEGQQRLLLGQLEILQQNNDPLRKLQIQKAERELKAPQKNWQKLDDDTLFDPDSGETKDISGGPGKGQFRFEGNSVEAQSLNGLMDAGTLTPAQAQQLGAGKTITGPNGEIIFMTPQGVFGQSAQGGPVQPVLPPQAAPQPAQPTGPQGAMPLPTPPLQPGAAPGGPPVPAPAPPPASAGPTQRPGMIPITDPKPVKATETQRNRESSVNQAFDAITGELDRYQTLVGKTGIEVAPGDAKDNLNTVRQGIMLQMKELFNLGVLNGPDLSLMERMIYDPVVDPLKEGGLANMPGQIWTGMTGGAGDRAKNSVTELKRMLTGIKQSVGTSIRQQQDGATATGAPPPPTGAGPATPQTDDDFNALPSGALYIDPDDGKPYRKP